MTGSNLLKSRCFLVLCGVYLALPIVEWLIPSFRSTFDVLDEFISIVFLGFVLIWFIGQVRNYPPNQVTAGELRPSMKRPPQTLL
jgi:hypothetical protein